ncbi:DUF5590 domain-containing protein [Streptococcus sp. 32226D021BW]|uniref:cell wall elongation regulator TseB-like domain-containing protein n=1 Tax=Streptococcus sp. SS-4456 TaxID=3072286 RepID=UPI00200672DC|nr:DUF5590 domain-containing protein [Streptococcus suis]HEL1613264.1 DUF5590 domain-containing protein [Streptococcus suis]HEM4129133.1 DUF5590 domain-containing protein [Streptococcus suis]
MEKKIFQLLEWMASKTGQLVLGSFILLSVVTFSIFTIWDMAAAPFNKARSHAVAVATEYADLQTVKDFSIYNGTETYFSVFGTTSQGEDVAVLIPEASSTVYVYPLAQGISQEEAQAIAKENGAGQVERVLLGIRDDKPIWEVKSGTAYYLVEFETGSFVKKEGL